MPAASDVQCNSSVAGLPSYWQYGESAPPRLLQHATSAAAGLAREGKLPVFGTYATFAAARNLDQIRTSVCYGNFNVMIAGAHGGVSVGADGATHQALEDLFAMQGLPNMSVVVPCDVVETRKATSYLLLQHKGPKYIRFAREATPELVTAAFTLSLGAIALGAGLAFGLGNQRLAGEITRRWYDEGRRRRERRRREREKAADSADGGGEVRPGEESNQEELPLQR